MTGVLLRFEVSNHRSIMEPAELSMIAVDEDRPAMRSFELLSERVLTVAGIYGPNASGKSNVLDALAWLSAAVGTSLRMWDGAIPREPFKFAPGPTSPSVFEVDMMVGGVRYGYRLELDSSAVVFEGLYNYPRRARRTLFERQGLELSLRRGLGTLAGTRDLLTPTTLALSAAMRSTETEVVDFARALAGIGTLGIRVTSRRGSIDRAGFPIPTTTQRMFLENDGDDASEQNDVERTVRKRDLALALLRFADLGIDDVRIIKEQMPSIGNQSSLRRWRTMLLHRSEDEQLPFDLGDESAGTRTWFGLIGPVLAALRTGQLLLFDEIDASLHPRLSARLLELFQDPVTNPRGAQLVFTSHDTSLLNHLNRDEVWLTEKGPRGETTLTALAEYGGDKVRRSLNLERAYLQGRFGAVPELDQHVLRTVLGLAAEHD
jgi:hypothetical protein